MADVDKEAHIQRSILLDRFAKIERQAIDFLSRHGKTACPKAPFSNKMQAVRDLINDKGENAKTSKRIECLLEQLAMLYRLRSGIVHSKIEQATSQNGGSLFIFRNVAETKLNEKFNPIVLTLSEMKEIDRMAADLANKLGQLAKSPNPPSPPPPSQAAATDP